MGYFEPKINKINGCIRVLWPKNMILPFFRRLWAQKWLKQVTEKFVYINGIFILLVCKLHHWKIMHETNYDLISGEFCLVVPGIPYFYCLGSKMTPTVFYFSRKNYSTDLENLKSIRSVTKFLTKSRKEFFEYYFFNSE